MWAVQSLDHSLENWFFSDDIVNNTQNVALLTWNLSVTRICKCHQVDSIIKMFWGRIKWQTFIFLQSSERRKLAHKSWNMTSVDFLPQIRREKGTKRGCSYYQPTNGSVNRHEGFLFNFVYAIIDLQEAGTRNGERLQGLQFVVGMSCQGVVSILR